MKYTYSLHVITSNDTSKYLTFSSDEAISCMDLHMAAKKYMQSNGMDISKTYVLSINRLSTKTLNIKDYL